MQNNHYALRKILRPIKVIKMKKIASLFLVLIFNCINFANAEIYTFKENSKKTEDIEIVKFSNGETIKNIKSSPDPKEIWGYKIGVFDSKNKAKYVSDPIQNDIVSIEAAYPNAKEALVAVVSSGSSGSCCPFKTYYVAYITKNQLFVHELNTSMTGDIQINVNINKRVLVGIEAQNVSESSENKYGDRIKGTRSLVPEKGFIKKEFKRKFIELVGVHPEDFFSHKLHREKLADALGFENFKKLRRFMTVASDSELEDGQFIVFSGMLPHSGGSQSGAVVIDAINEQYWSFWFDEESNYSSWQGSTTKWNDEVADLIKSNHKFASDKVLIDFKNNKFSIRKR